MKLQKEGGMFVATGRGPHHPIREVAYTRREAFMKYLRELARQTRDYR